MVTLTLKEVEQIQGGLRMLAKIITDKKNKISFEFRWNVKQWLDETEKPLKDFMDIKNDLIELHGEKIFTKESIISSEVKVTNYDEEGAEKLTYWRSVVPPEKQKGYDKEYEEALNKIVEIGKVKLFKTSDLKKMEESKSIDPLTSELLYSLSPIIENDSEDEEE